VAERVRPGTRLFSGLHEGIRQATSSQAESIPEADRPTDGNNSMSAAAGNLYDVIVIGTSPIGQTVTDRARAAGLSVAAVERELVGGECSYWACIPSKAMPRPVVAVADAGQVEGAAGDQRAG
jgi:hypothetical protein